MEMLRKDRNNPDDTPPEPPSECPSENPPETPVDPDQPEEDEAFDESPKEEPEEDPKEAVIPETETNGAAQISPEMLTEEQLGQMTVAALRRLARALEITNMTRQEIRFARKQELIHAILEFT
ncbi:MAG: Rho termination factor N-terminal domain-containing protein [Fusicatenibacter sp.]